MSCFIPLVQPIVPLLLFDLLFHVQCGVWLLLFSLLFRLSCLTCCSTPFVGPIIMFLLFNLLLPVQHGVPLLLFNLLLQFSCLTCYFACLFNLLFCSSCSTSCSTLLFLLLLFQISIFPPLRFLQTWIMEKLSKFEFFKPNLEGESFCFQSVLMDFFNYYFFKEMVVNNVFVCCVQELFEHCRFNYTHCNSLLHIAFHLHNCIIYFFSTLHLCFSFSIACKCLSWLSCSWWNIILAKTYLFLISPLR